HRFGLFLRRPGRSFLFCRRGFFLSLRLRFFFFFGGRLLGLGRRFLLFLPAALGRAFRDQRQRLFQRDAFRIVGVRHGRVGVAVGDVGPVTALHQLDGRS